MITDLENFRSLMIENSLRLCRRANGDWSLIYDNGCEYCSVSAVVGQAAIDQGLVIPVPRPVPHLVHESHIYYVEGTG